MIDHRRRVRRDRGRDRAAPPRDRATSRSSRRRPTSAAPGTTTATPARPATCPATCTRSPTRSAATGRGCARRRRRSTPTCTTSRATTASSALIRTNTTVTALRVGRGSAAAGRSRPSDGRDLRGRRDRPRHRASCTSPRSRDRGRRDVRRPQLPLGRMGPRLRPRRQARRRSSAPAPAPCSSSPRSPREVARLTVFQRTGNWFLPRKNRLYPRAGQGAVERVPGLQAFRRSFMFEYSESLTLAIRHPRTFGRLGARCARRRSCAGS